MTIAELYQHFLQSSGVSTDTRQIQPNQLFFALKGDNFNGNKYAAQALGKGARLAVIDEEEYATENSFLVDDVLKSLQELAQHHRRQLTIPVIGLTGSNGKTTSKELLVAALSQKYEVGYTHGNLNNHIGVPLTLLNLPREAEVAVIEMGANHQREIAFLCSISQPDHGLITNFGKAHLEGFGGFQGVVKGKSELYNYLRENNRTAWVNIADPIQLEQSHGMKRFGFGADKQADYPVFPLAFESHQIGVRFADQEVKSQLTGHYNFSNLASAVALAQFFGVSDVDIKKGLETYQPANNRSQIEHTNSGNLLVSDYYNANPSSVAAALDNLEQFKGNRKWVILGDMFEVGDTSQDEHQLVAERLKKLEGLEGALLIGEYFMKCESAYLQFSTTREALQHLEAYPLTNKTILIKGSRGMKLENLRPLL